MYSRVCKIFLFCIIQYQVTYAQDTGSADVLFELGRTAHLESRLTESSDLYERALFKYQQEDNLVMQAKTKRFLVSVYWRLGNHPRALELAEYGIELARLIEDQSLVISYKTQMGTIRNRQGYHEMAYQHLTHALDSAYELNDTTLIGIILYNFANLKRNMGDIEESIRIHKQELFLLAGADNLIARAFIKNSLGESYIEAGRLHDALTSFEISLQLFEQSSFSGGFALVYANLAYVHQEMGNYLLALDYFYKCLKIHRNLDHQHNLARIYGAIGNLYYEQNDFNRAEHYYYKSNNIFIKLGNPANIGESLKKLGNNYFKKGHYEKALEYKTERLALYKKLDNNRKLGDAYFNLGVFHKESGNYDEALQYINKAYEIKQPIQNKTELMQYLANIGSIYAQREEFELAHDYLKQAYDISISINPELPNLNIIRELAELNYAMGTDKSFYYAELLYNTVEKQRIQIGAAGRSKAGFFSNYASFYNQVASWYINDNGNLVDAYRWVESAKARAFVDDLAEATYNLDAQLEISQLNKKYKKSQRVIELSSRLELVDSTEHHIVLQDLREAELAYDAFLSRLRLSNPVYSHFDYPEPVTLQQAQAKISDKTVILEYSFSDSRLIGFAIAKDKTLGWTINKSNTNRESNLSLEEVAKKFREDIINMRPERDIMKSGTVLAKKLLGPATELLNQANQLIIVAEGILAYIPFEALVWNDEYLIQNYQVKYTPSVTALTLLRNPKEEYPMDLLQIVNPDFNSHRPNAKGVTYESLPFSVLEAKAISPLFDNVTTLKGKEANEAAIKNMDLTQYRFIHFATHGLLNEENPDMSGLVLARNNNDGTLSKEDGFLRSAEIYALSLNADIVVLSACETGLGNEILGEGVLGLQRAFFHAGASTVMVSIWQVQDRSTSILMAEFYKEIIKYEKEKSRWSSIIKKYLGLHEDDIYGYKAAAMRNAKLTLMSSQEYSHPVYWAPFIVVGK